MYFLYRYGTTTRPASGRNEPPSQTQLQLQLQTGSRLEASLHGPCTLALWQTHMAQQDEMPEAVLLNELFFVLQGGQSEHFQLGDDDRYSLDPSCHVSAGNVALLKDAFVVAMDCRAIRGYLAQQETHASPGQVKASFHGWLHGQLQDYLRELAHLETLVAKPTTPEPGAAPQASPGILQPHGLGLRRLKSLLTLPAARLRLATQLVQDFGACSDDTELLTRSSAYLHCGDAYVAPMLGTLMVRLVKPVLHQLDKWIFEGELLSDSTGTFFIQDTANTMEAGRDHPGNDAGVSPTEDAAVWEHKFVLVESRLPWFINKAMALKVPYGWLCEWCCWC